MTEMADRMSSAEKERSVWERLYLDHNGEHDILGMESAWKLNGCDKMSESDLHRQNLVRIRWNLDKMWNRDADTMLDAQPYTAGYVQELIGSPKYLAMVSGSDQGISGTLFSWTEGSTLYVNDKEFMCPNDDEYREMAHTFYSKDAALHWLDDNGTGKGSLGFRDISVSHKACG